jgi:phosphoserine phosphatase RsbX
VGAVVSASTITGPLQHGVAVRAAVGQGRCGDEAVVAEAAGGALVAVVDGLGHGPAAADAAQTAAEVLTAAAAEPVVELVRRCHAALSRTRGAALSLAKVQHSGRLEWVGVGNVRGAVVRAAGGAVTNLVTRGGVVGMRLPTLRATTVGLEADDLLVMFTDGVDDGAARDVVRLGDPVRAARRLLDGHGARDDDALVAVARYLGSTS